MSLTHLNTSSREPLRDPGWTLVANDGIPIACRLAT
jgi:hypothetical protein